MKNCAVCGKPICPFGDGTYGHWGAKQDHEPTPGSEEKKEEVPSQ